MFTRMKRLLGITPMPRKVPEDVRERLSQISEECALHTPDLMKIEQRELHLIFLPDYMSQLRSLQMYSPAVVLPVNSEVPFHQGECYTSENFTLFKCVSGDDGKELGLGRYAIPMDREFETNGYGRIRGDLFATKSTGVRTLDKWYKNRVEFYRKPVDIIFPYTAQAEFMDTSGETFGKAGEVRILKYPRFFMFKANMYVGREKFWMDKLDGGYRYRPVRMFKPERDYFGDKTGRWLNHYPYYRFSKLELED